jgi:aldehyde:ferredoxin oxidoreductase
MRILSGRWGHRMADDGLPNRFAAPLPRGASAEHPVDPDVLETAIADYYRERGYRETGPTEETLRRLGIEDCVGFLVSG